MKKMTVNKIIRKKIKKNINNFVDSEEKKIKEENYSIIIKKKKNFIIKKQKKIKNNKIKKIKIKRWNY